MAPRRVQHVEGDGGVSHPARQSQTARSAGDRSTPSLSGRRSLPGWCSILRLRDTVVPLRTPRMGSDPEIRRFLMSLVGIQIA